jgi:hypothetical protein
MENMLSFGQKVKPINKTPRIREHDNCATYYQQLELKQDFLYVVGIDSEESERLNKPCYWCNIVPSIGGDSFTQSDLILYTETL